WVSPIKNMCRTATRTVEYQGKTIQEGQKLLMLYPSGNRDAERFPDPDTFDMQRSPNDHVAFGFGTHFCLGSSLARLELRALFEDMADRLPDLRLVGTDEPGHRAANFVSGYEAMQVTFTPTAPRTLRARRRRRVGTPSVTDDPRSASTPSACATSPASRCALRRGSPRCAHQRAASAPSVSNGAPAGTHSRGSRPTSTSSAPPSVVESAVPGSARS